MLQKCSYENFILADVYSYWLGDLVRKRGWPFDAAMEYERVLATGSGVKHFRSDHRDWSVWEAIANALIALATLFALWFVCEWQIRRLAARKGA